MDRDSIIKGIDTLIEQAGGKLAEEGSLRIEYDKLQKELQTMQAELTELKSTPAEIYRDDSRKLLDEQTALHQKNRIRNLNKDIKDKQRELEALKKEEETLNSDIENHKKNLQTTNESIANIESRRNIVEAEETKEIYDEMLNRARDTVNTLNIELSYLQEQYAHHQGKIVIVTEEINSIKDEISDKEATLASIEADLNREDAYIDKRKKSADEERIKELEELISSTEARRNEIVANPVIIGSDAKKALLDNDNTQVVTKASALSELAKENKYMEVEDKDVTLSEELRSKEEERDSFHSQYDQNEYSINTSNADKVVIEYLEGRKKELESEIERLKTVISSLDNEKARSTEESIGTIKAEISSLSEQINSYKEIVDNTEKMSDKVELQAAYDSKKAQKSLAEESLSLLTNYQTRNILEANRLNETIGRIETEIKGIDSEIDYLKNKEIAINSNGKDILAQKAAMDELKKKAKVVQDIKFAMKFAQTPSQILSSISEALGTSLTPKEEIKEKAEENEAILTTAEEPALVTDEKESDITFTKAFSEESVAQDLEVSAPQEDAIEKKPVVETNEPAAGEKENTDKPPVEEYVIKPLMDNPKGVDSESLLSSLHYSEPEQEVAQVPEETSNISELINGSKVVGSEEVEVSTPQEVVGFEEVSLDPVDGLTQSNNEEVLKEEQPAPAPIDNDLESQIASINEYFNNISNNTQDSQNDDVKLGLGV